MKVAWADIALFAMIAVLGWRGCDACEAHDAQTAYRLCIDAPHTTEECAPLMGAQ
jgi:hypothetical protein